MLPSVVALWIGLWWIETIYGVWSTNGFLLVSLFLLIICLYLACEAYLSARVLMNTRTLLLEAVGTQNSARGPANVR